MPPKPDHQAMHQSAEKALGTIYGKNGLLSQAYTAQAAGLLSDFFAKLLATLGPLIGPLIISLLSGLLGGISTPPAPTP